MIVNTSQDLLKILSESKKINVKIGTVNGTYDLLHDGHVDAINFAYINCDQLIILINSDKSVRLYKGPSRPIENALKRAKNIEELFPSSLIYVFDELNPLNILEKIKPSIHFIGPDWGKKTLEQQLVEKNGGVVKFINKKYEISTSEILKNIGINDKFNRAVFLDRDGTIIKDKNYLTDIENIEFFPDIEKILLKLLNLGYLLFIVSNQSMVARKISTKKNALQINKYIVNQLNDMGVVITESYLDFSHPNKPSKTRKPNTGFLEIAAYKHKLALKNSWMIGDKESDILFGKRGNTKTIQIIGSHKISEFADFTIKDINEINKIIKK